MDGSQITEWLRAKSTRENKIRALKGAAIFLAAACVVWLFRLNYEISSRISQGWFRPPVEIYAHGETLVREQNISPDLLIKTLQSLQYRERAWDQPLLPKDFAHLSLNQCEDAVGGPFLGETTECVHFQTPEENFGPQRKPMDYLVGFNSDHKIEKILAGTPFKEVERIELHPQLIAQFYSGEPILRNIVRIGDVPIECLQAVTAIEDSQFLQHKGVSITGLGRAIMRNLLAGRYAQGGSTITQQLIKNYFLTPEKTIRRKISELLMALLLEAKLDKDQILENYLNVVYMGQRGPFQVIGLSAASDFYFAKPLAHLGLPECTLLAAMINSPGRYNPFLHPEGAIQRRNFVLERMVETGMIDSTKAEQARSAPLPPTPDLRLKEPAPYFTQAVFREIEKMGLSIEGGLRIYTTIDISAQDMAQKKVLQHAENLEKNYKSIADLKAQGKDIQDSLISIDVQTGEVLALVGGRQFIKTQYNRVLDAHRQVGSVMKPFVYLTALEGRDVNGATYTPVTVVDDSPFTHKYEGQSWSPQNYEKEFNGPIPIFYALKNSINVATAKIGIQVGLTNVVDVAVRAGITSPITPLPSLTLGAFEIYPWELATSFLTLARMGERRDLTFIRSIESLTGRVLHEASPKQEQAFAPENVAVLIGMMKQTLLTGTGRLAKIQGFQLPAAGKTGTTSDTKDTWFIGFTPHVLTVTWTGYDDNTPTGLTGASGALPLWIDFMKDYTSRYPPRDFQSPEGVERFTITPEEYKNLVPNAKPHELEGPTELIRRK